MPSAVSAPPMTSARPTVPSVDGPTATHTTARRRQRQCGCKARTGPSPALPPPPPSSGRRGRTLGELVLDAVRQVLGLVVVRFERAECVVVSPRIAVVSEPKVRLGQKVVALTHVLGPRRKEV